MSRVEEEEEMGKVGHPIEMPSRKRGINYSVYMDGVLLDALEEIRWRERKSMSALVRKALTEYVQQHKEGNDHFKLDTWQEDPTFQAMPTILSPKEKWQEYLKQCNNEELTRLGIQSGFIRSQVEHIRQNQFRKK